MMKETWSTDPKAGYVFVFSCAFFSALMIVLIKWVQDFIPPLSLLFLILVIAAIALTGILHGRSSWERVRRIPPKGWMWVVGISSLTFFGYWTFFEALLRLDPTVATFIGRVETLVTIFIGMAVLGERFRRHEFAGAGLVVAGVVVVRYVGGVTLSDGMWLCLVSACFWGVSEGLGKIAVRTVPPLVFTWGRCLVLGPAFFFAAALSADGIVLPETPVVWIGVAATAVSGPVIGRFCYMKSLSIIPVSKAALVMQFQPVWVAAIACVLLGTLPTPREWVGGVLIIAGCVMLVRRVR